MNLGICPVCKKLSFAMWGGNYDGFKKVSPDYGKCHLCGFTWEEHVDYSVQQQAKKYKEAMQLNFTRSEEKL